MTRLTQLRKQRQDADYAPEMPEVEAPHLIAYLWEVGPLGAAGMGPAVLSHSEIAAWCQLTGLELSAWEARTLRSLSRAYLNEMQEAEDPKRRAPWEPCAPDPAAVANDMRTAIRALAQL